MDKRDKAQIPDRDPAGRSIDPVGFVQVLDIVPDALQEIRYCSSYNFIGRRIDGYEKPVALLTVPAAEALKTVSDEAKKDGFRLKIYDTYRPLRAVADFLRWAKDPEDTRMKADFYPDVDKSELVPRGYIAEKSGHSRRSTVDLTLCDLATGKEIDMGGTFDWFGRESHSDWCGNPETGEYTGRLPADAPSGYRISAGQFRNRLKLRSLMMRQGFLPVKQEWWHFTLSGEPYPDTYFDSPVR